MFIRESKCFLANISLLSNMNPNLDINLDKVNFLFIFNKYHNLISK